jgi:hypothetical protein
MCSPTTSPTSPSACPDDRRGFVQANRFVHAGDWLKRGAPLATKLAGQTAGILGLGRIGKAIAERLSAMGMKIAYTGRKPQNVPYKFIADLKGLAAASDFLIVACPGGEATRNIVNAEVLAALGKKGRSSTSPGARSSTSRRSCARCKTALSRARSRRIRRRAEHPGALLRWTTSCCCRMSAARRRRRARRWVTFARRTSTRGSRESRC